MVEQLAFAQHIETQRAEGVEAWLLFPISVFPHSLRNIPHGEDAENWEGLDGSGVASVNCVASGRVKGSRV